MKTFKRIEKICEAVDFAIKKFDKVIVADIGTDHGYVAEKLSENEKIERVIATDISEKSLNKLEDLIIKNNLSKITTIVGDGLSVIERVDVCVIAGMGGLEIKKMLQTQNKDANNKNKCNIFVLQPTQNSVELKMWLMSSHYKILKDVTICDADRFYSIIIVDVSKFCFSKKTIFNLWFGKDCKENMEDFFRYILHLKELLSFTGSLTKKRAKQDVILFQKYKLSILLKKFERKYAKNLQEIAELN